MNLMPTKEVQLVVGGESRVDLLPVEVANRAKSRSTRRALIGAVVVTAVLVAGGYGYSVFEAGLSTTQLSTAQGRTETLVQQQGDFIEIRQVQSDLLGAQAAKAVGASTEIDWATYFAVIDETLPVGVGLSGIALESATPIEAGPTGTTVPLRGAKVATFTLEVSSPAVIDVKSWLIALQSVTGYVDASPKAVTRQDDGTYSASVVLNLNEAAYWNRYLPDDASATDAESTNDMIED